MAGVSIGTVSRVVNRPEQVSEKLRTRVLQVIRATNYRPSSAARVLARQRHQTIGVVSEVELTRTYYSAGLLQGIANALTDSEHHLALAMVHEAAEAARLSEIPMLSTHSVDGLILDLHKLRGDVDGTLFQLGLPYVFVNPSGSRPLNAVRPDDVAAGRKATRYLLDRGHRKVLYLPLPAEDAHSSHADRMRGYVEALSRTGAGTHLAWREDHTRNRHEEFVAAIRSGCTAVVAYDAKHAAEVAQVCYESGLRIPDDVSLVACDDDPVIACSVVPVTCMRLDRLEMGREAVRMILERCGNDGIDATTRIVMPQLQERRSVCKREE